MTFRRAPKDVPEKLELQREIQQVMLQAILAEAGGRFLGIRVDAPLDRVAVPCARQPLANFGIRETDRSRLVKIVKHLTVQAIAVDGDRGKKALI